MPFQLGGNVANGGIVELPFGATLRSVLQDFGGGSLSGRPLRAVQIGGPLGAYLPASLWDTPLDYEAFAAHSAMLGHGGIVAFDDTVDLGEQAQFAMQFCAHESCGKCTPCRIGSVRGVEVIERIRRGERTDENVALLEDLCETMETGSLCALGGLTPMPVRSILKHFRGDLIPGSVDERRRPRASRPRHACLPRRSGRCVSRIDGIDVEAAEGTSVLRAALAAGIGIPKLCATDSLAPFGSCRVCLVEIQGRKGTPASCTTPVEAGMVVRTQTETLARVRKGVLELYISDHPLDCLTCAANGDCELQDVAGEVGLRDVRYGIAGANHLDQAKDVSNPYFAFDPSKCIVCSRCVRACEEVQGTFALTVAGRGFDSAIAASAADPFIDSECVSCGACVQACPTATLIEKSVVEHGQPDRVVKTTCAYCGVGCSFKAELKGDQLIRMEPDPDGGANHGHSCVKGRFAWGYATHRDRVLKPLLRERIEDAWREASWDEAIGFAAQRFRAIADEYGRHAIGGISSSRCTNEEVFVVQKMVRAAFGNNNIDTCARVCHSPTGYGLKQTFGTSAGTQDFQSVDHADVVMVIGANPTDAHPVFASRLKRRLRQGAQLIVADPRRIDLVRSAHVEARHHLQLRPGTNVALINALAHVVGHRRAGRRSVRRGAVRARIVRALANVHRRRREFARSSRVVHRCTGRRTAARGAPLCGSAQRHHLLRPRRDRTQPGQHDGDGAREPRHGNRPHRPRRRRREPVARPEQRARRVRHGLVPARILGLSPHFRRRSARLIRIAMARATRRGARPAHPEHAVAGDRRRVSRSVHSGRGSGAVGSEHAARGRRIAIARLPRRAGPVPQRDVQVRSRLPARYVVPGERRHVHERGAAHQPRASGDGGQRRGSANGKPSVAWPRRWAIRCTTTTPLRSWTRSPR